MFIVGPAGGGAILVGTKAEPGIIVDAGTLRDLEFEDFTVAVTATGAAYVTNVRIRSSTVAVRGETAAKLTVDNLDITGTIAACMMGIVLNGAADLKVTTLATRNLATTLDAKDQSTVNIAHANITGDPGCMPSDAPARYLMSGNTTKTFAISDSLLDNGSYGIGFSAARVMIDNTIIRNMNYTGLEGGSGGVSMVGGEFTNNRAGPFEGGGAIDSFTNVTFNTNGGFIYWYGVGNFKLVMRGCTINAMIQLEQGAVADLGNVTSPGNNTLRSDNSQALEIGGDVGPPVDAVGNTWRPVQEADSEGRYPKGKVVRVPVPYAGPRTNYSKGARDLNL